VTDKKLDHYLNLNVVFHDAPTTMHACLAEYPEYADCLANMEAFIHSRRANDKTKQYWLQRHRSWNADAYCQQLNAHGIACIVYDTPDYPQWLTHIYHPPLILYCKGNPETLHHRLFAVVGTRHPSMYGIQATQSLCADLSAHFTLVSGLALGVDAHVHQTALQHNTPTIGVLAIGLDDIYPKKNSRIAEAMLETGAWVSEQPLGIPAIPYRFPQRNRIISGLCEGLLVTQAGHASGAVITAHLALEQNRNVYAVPGPINSEKSIGTHQLIQDGAKLVHHSADILSDYLEFPDKRVEHASTEQTRKPVDLSTDEAHILSCMGMDTILSLDDLCEKTSIPISSLLHYISLLEIKSWIKKTETGHYIRCSSLAGP
jgi:DNA processing protein